MPLPQVQIGDNLLDTALLASVSVTQQLNRHWRCTVVCRNTQDQRIATEDLVGQPVEIKTVDEQGTEHLHFAGFIHDVALQYEPWGSYGATLTAVSDSYAMDITAHKQYYTEGTLQSLAGVIAGRSGLSVAVNAPGSKPLNYVQYGETDFSFLNRVVDDYGAWLRPTQGGVEVFDSFQSGSALQWKDHDGLTHFALSARCVPPSYSGSHYDHHAMESNTFQALSKPPQFYDGAGTFTAAAQSASQQLPSGFEPQRARAMTLATYSEQLQAESERVMGSAVTGRGTSQSQLLKAGDTVQIEGVLDAAGTYGLISVEHHWTPTGYENQFACTPWKHYRDSAPPAMRVWEGVAPARVTAHNDPKKMGRLQVQFFWQDGNTQWARMVTPHAGPDRGMMMMPEVGDEVAVMFEDGDPERPVIVGSVWNGVQHAPRYDFRGGDIEPNNVKRIVTKSGNRLHLSDKPGQETVFLATPNTTSLSMTEKSDETGRNLIHIHSDGDIVLSAGGRVHIQSQTFSREIGTPAPAARVGAASAGLAQPVLTSGAHPAPAGGKPKTNCDYLNNANERVLPPKSAFDKGRKPYQLGETYKGKHIFPGHGRIAATTQDVTIGGHQVDIIRASSVAPVKGSQLPTNQEVASALAAVPQKQLDMVHQVQLSPFHNPDDASWAKQYNIPGFQSEATAGADGIVSFYPVPTGDPMAMDSTFVHETGHTFSKNLYGEDTSKWNEWGAAMAADKRHPSQYGSNSRDEDFAESMVMYRASKGTPCEAEARKLYPHRYAVLDKITAPPKPPAHPKPSAPPSSPSLLDRFEHWLHSL